MLSELTRLGPGVLRFQRRVMSSNRTTAAARPEINHHKRAPSALERANRLLVSLAIVAKRITNCRRVDPFEKWLTFYVDDLVTDYESCKRRGSPGVRHATRNRRQNHKEGTETRCQNI